MIKKFDDVYKLRTQRIIKEGKRDGGDQREEFQRDYGRLIHSPSFRRLQGKSQVFGAGSGDYYRTRLTHTLEVAQIARQIAERLSKEPITEYSDSNPGLQIDPLVVECAALAHDLGHPPFGHKGEHDLNEYLKVSGERYEGNAQNFRILMNIEKRYSIFDGLNLTYAVLLAVNKYPYLITKDKKGLYETEWLQISPIREAWGVPEGKATLEAQLMDISDDIAYSTHDIEDGMKAEKIRIDPSFLLQTEWLSDSLLKEVEKARKKEPYIWEEVRSVKEEIERVMTQYIETWNKIKEENKHDSFARQELKAHYVNLFANRVGVIQDADWYRVSLVQKEDPTKEDLALWRHMIILKKLAWVTLVEDLRVQRLQKRGEIILEGLWKVFHNIDISKKDSSRIIPRHWIEIYESSQLEGKNQKISWERFVADYISGMTDSYAEKLYEELYGSRAGNIYGE